MPQRKESIIFPIRKKGYKMDCNNYGGVSLLSTLYKILSNILKQEWSHMQIRLWNINEGLGGIDQQSTKYLAFGKYLKRNGNMRCDN